MSLRISFELDENDLKHFRLIMRAARNTLSRKSPEDVVVAAETVLAGLVNDTTPGFIVDRLKKLQLMMRMISDIDWRLSHAETKRVLCALAYFAEPEDLIPDQIPGLGFLDDAIMVELVVRELRHEIEAYDDFCDFRSKQTGAGKVASLAARRDELQSRMRRRRQRSTERAGQAALRLFD